MLRGGQRRIRAACLGDTGDCSNGVQQYAWGPGELSWATFSFVTVCQTLVTAACAELELPSEATTRTRSAPCTRDFLRPQIFAIFVHLTFQREALPPGPYLVRLVSALTPVRSGTSCHISKAAVLHCDSSANHSGKNVCSPRAVRRGGRSLTAVTSARGSPVCWGAGSSCVKVHGSGREAVCSWGW